MPCPPALDADTVDLRWLALDDIAAAHWPRLAAQLDDTERARAERFHFARDRDAYVAAHALTRALLSLHAPCAPAAWRFTANRHGRPEVIAQGPTPPLRFNLSHTRGLVAVAVTLERDIGVDVEQVNPPRLTLALAARTFAPAEVAFLRRLPRADLPEALYAFWTLKEAYIKAVGRGLSLPLDSFAFTLAPLRIAFSDPTADDPAAWHFARLRPTAAHRLALAVRHPTPAAVQVHARAMDGAGLLAICDQGADGPGRISRI